MMAAMVELFCDSFKAVPRRILLDIDDTEDRQAGCHQRAPWQDAGWGRSGADAMALRHEANATSSSVSATI
jgi:hypothetical protein